MQILPRAFIIGILLLAALPVAARASSDSALQVVHETTERMLSVLKEEKQVIEQNPERIYELVNRIILPHFDFSRMSRWVLGKYWRGATDAQRERFIAEFRTLLVRTYATALLEYSDQKVEYQPVREATDATDVTVRTAVKQPGGFPIPINYSMFFEGGEWKVYDVTIDGVSLVANYRSAFTSQIQRGGLEQLIGLLAQRNAGVNQ